MSSDVAFQTPARLRPTRPSRGAPSLRGTAIIATTARYLFLTVLSLVFMFPFWWLVTSSLKGPSEIRQTPPTFLPESPRWQNYVEVFTYQPFARHLFNSIYLGVVVTIGVLAISAISGYAFARLRFRGRSVIFVVLLVALMMPTEVTIVPLFSLMRSLGLVNTHVPLILIPIFGPQTILGAFLMRQFFLQLPRETEEAGMVDGLGHLGVFLRLALPLARPALGALAIVTFLYSWNLLLEPLVFIDDPDLYTVPLGLNSYTDSYGVPIWHLQLAATSISIVPMVVAFLVARRQLIVSFAFTAGK
jgi:multiple sugar transport system permease protein